MSRMASTLAKYRAGKLITLEELRRRLLDHTSVEHKFIEESRRTKWTMKGTVDRRELPPIRWISGYCDGRLPPTPAPLGVIVRPELPPTGPRSPRTYSCQHCGAPGHKEWRCPERRAPSSPEEHR